MKYSKFFKLLEKKDHLINKLTSLTPEQKQEIILFFNKHPNFEKEIDWNRKNLTYEDFEEVIFKERVSKSKLSDFVKEGRHYLTLYKANDLVVYQPLTWLGSRYLASKDVAPYVEGKWCTAYQKEIYYWEDYSFENKEVLLYLSTPTTKYALQISKRGKYNVWDAQDIQITKKEFFNKIKNEVPNIEEVLKDLIPKARVNHSLVVRSRKIEKEDLAILEELRIQAKDAQIKAFPKAFPRQVKKKGFYQWDGDLTLEDLTQLGLYDEDSMSSDVSKFHVSGDVIFEECFAGTIYLPSEISGKFTCEASFLRKVVIPQGITSISDNAFAKCCFLKDITLPNGITSIGENAFNSCKSLTNLNIPNGVKNINYNAFEYCTALESIILPDSVTYLGGYAFCECSSLKEVILSKNLYHIDSRTFSNCKSLVSIVIPEGVTSIEDCAFENCLKLSSVELPQSLLKIESRAFDFCVSLSSIELPSKLEFIGDSAFFKCQALTKMVIPNTVKTLLGYVFNKCSGLKEVILSTNLTQIEQGTFMGCTSLKTINIPNKVKKISTTAFEDCYSLTKVTIGKGIEHIEENSFEGCDQLISVDINRNIGMVNLEEDCFPLDTEVLWKGKSEADILFNR